MLKALNAARCREISGSFEISYFIHKVWFESSYIQRHSVGNRDTFSISTGDDQPLAVNSDDEPSEDIKIIIIHDDYIFGKHIYFSSCNMFRPASSCNLWQTLYHNVTWWSHHMETFSALLPFCAGNSPVTGEFPSQRPVTRSFDDLFDLRLNKQTVEQTMDTPMIWDTTALIMTSL